MLKTHGHRRLALLLALVFVTSLLAACSSSQSSTDEPLSHPGKDYIGTIRMDMDPSNATIEITKVDDAVTNNVLTKIAGFSVTSSDISFAGNTLTGSIKFKWTGPERLEDLSIRVYEADAIGLNATINNADTCKGLPLATCLGAGPPEGDKTEGIVYVGDEALDGAETEYECLGLYATPGPCKERALRLMSPGCTSGTIAGNSVTAVWRMTETLSGNANYTFYAAVFGTKVPPLVKDDPRYDVESATINMKAYRADPANASYPAVRTDLPLTYVKTGQWFYVLTYVDAPGDQSRGQTAMLCDDGDGNTTCSIGPTTADHYDFYFVEDQANFNQPVLTSPAEYWKQFSSYNTGFMFAGELWYQVQWDPAVLRCNDNGEGTGTPLGTGIRAFRTKGLLGTKMYSYGDNNIVDQWAEDTAQPRGLANRSLHYYVGTYNYGGAPLTYPPLPDGLDVDDYGTGIQQGDFPSGYLTLKAIGPSGSGSPIRLSPSINTLYNVGIGNKTGTNGTAAIFVVQKSPHYPIWVNATGVNEGAGASLGHYNEQIAWVCVQ